MQDVIQEAKRLSDNGCKEVVLTGIHLSSYGVDLGTDLITLIEKVHDLPRIARIRLGSLEPKIVTEEFAGRLAKLPKLCPHFHLSLQSGCDAVLKRMNRKYTCAEYLQACELLRGCFTHPAITTDVIVGFPGETEEEFQETRRFLKKIGFFEIHIFKYSLRKGTRAAAMEHQIPEQVKNVRSDILFSDLAPMNEAFLDWHLGREAEALLEEQVSFEGKEYFLGHTKEYVKIAVPAEEPGQSLVNRVVRGRITSRLKERVLQMENVLEETS